MVVKHIVVVIILQILIEISHANPLFSSQCTSQYSDYIYFHLYKSVGSYDVIQYSEAPQVFLNYPQFHPEYKTIFYLPGWGEVPASQESVQTVTTALLSKQYLNLIVIDYHLLIQSSKTILYGSSFWNSTFIGDCLGQMLIKYRTIVLQNMNSYQQYLKLHLISHSMGSQIMGFAARTYGKGLLRLTALDPAWPLYSPPNPHLSKDDARYLDCIHTDRGNYGYLYDIGHTDFYPNDGTRIQPYCQIPKNAYEFCSHHMSWKYYADSVLNPNSYPARECLEQSFCLVLNFTNTCYCKSYGYNVAYMGFYINTSMTGAYYLKTGNSAPYGLGINGL